MKLPQFDRTTARFAKAVVLRDAGKIIRHGDVYVVPSMAHQNVRHTVRRVVGGQWRCSCLDDDRHDGPCKHMIAVFLTIEKTRSVSANDEDEDEDEDDELAPGPGLTVAALRDALVGVRGDLVVTVRAGDGFAGGIVRTGEEQNCGGWHFALDCSDDVDDFDVEGDDT